MGGRSEASAAGPSTAKFATKWNWDRWMAMAARTAIEKEERRDELCFHPRQTPKSCIRSCIQWKKLSGPCIQVLKIPALRPFTISCRRAGACEALRLLVSALMPSSVSPAALIIQIVVNALL